MNDSGRAGAVDVAPPDADLDAVVTAYLKAVEAGGAPDRAAWLALHPEFAADLAGYFADLDQVDRLAEPLRAVAQALERDTPQEGIGLLTKLEGPARREPVPRSFGDYELLVELGRGGMGVVYRARQGHPNRLVALKMIRLDSPATGEIARRFRNEAEVVAQLDHPHLVPVYEVGEQYGQLFFSMKLMEGGSLASQLARFQAEPRAAAQLAATIARAVHHAHQRGVLHRDLKPANVLFDGAGRPYVTDFGLAKRVETDSSLTQSGAVVGTPSYMAPEQASGRKEAATTAADVYGLGAILYALLAGRPPFRGETVLETLEQVKTREPEPPGRGNPRVDRDLETVCLKCLDKEPQRRYGSAEALAMEIERWLSGEPIQARRISPWRRLLKWSRRHPAAGAVLVLAAVATLSFVLLTLRHNAQLEKEIARTEAAAQREREAAQNAQRGWAIAEEESRWARRAVNEMYTQLAEKWLAQQPRLQPVQREFLEKALAFYQRWVEEPGITPTMRRDTAQAFYRMGGIHRKLGQHEQAKQSYLRAIDLSAQLVAEFPSQATYAYELAGSHDGLAKVFEATGRLEDAVQSYQRCIDRCTPLVADFPDRSDYRYLKLSAQANRAMTLADLGRIPAAEQAYADAIAAFTKLTADHPQNAEYRATLANSHTNLGNLYFNNSRPGQAESAYREALKVFEKLVDDFPTVPHFRERLAYTLSNLAAVLKERPLEALKALDRARALQEKLISDFPDVPDYREELAATLGNVGVVHATAGRRDEAEKAYRASIALWQKLVGQFPNVLTLRRGLEIDLSNLRNLLVAAGRLAEAEEVSRDVVEARTQLAAALPKGRENRQMLATNAEELGSLLRQRGQPDKAEAAYRQALAIRQKLLEENPGEPELTHALARVLCDLSLVLVYGPHRERLPEARQLLEQALGHQQKALEARPDSADNVGFLAFLYLHLADVLLDLGEPGEAAKPAAELSGVSPDSVQHQCWAAGLFGRCAALAETAPGLPQAERPRAARAYAARAWQLLEAALARNPDHPLVLNEQAMLLATCTDPRLHDPARAVGLARKAVERTPRYAGFWSTLGVAQYRAGDWKAAQTALDKARALGGGDDRLFFLAMAYWRLGDKPQARKCHEQAVEWMAKNAPHDDGLARFRAESAGLLGIKEAAVPQAKEVAPSKK